jgi:MraZ protein
MATLIGEYECTLDNKGRFLLPANLKKQLESADQDRFVLNRGFEGCVVLYPMSEWDKETKRLSKLNLYVAKNRMFYRQFHNGATVVPSDTLGRLLVPKNLKQFAGIEREIILFAYSNRVELWAKEKYEKIMNDGTEDIASLAEDVMGKLLDDE